MKPIQRKGQRFPKNGRTKNPRSARLQKDEYRERNDEKTRKVGQFETINCYGSPSLKIRHVNNSCTMKSIPRPDLRNILRFVQ